MGEGRGEGSGGRWLIGDHLAAKVFCRPKQAAVTHPQRFSRVADLVLERQGGNLRRFRNVGENKPGQEDSERIGSWHGAAGFVSQVVWQMGRLSSSMVRYAGLSGGPNWKRASGGSRAKRGVSLPGWRCMKRSLDRKRTEPSGSRRNRCRPPSSPSGK